MDYLRITTPETAYSLGLLWTDGYIIKHSNGKYYSIGIRLAKSDFVMIEKCLLKSEIGGWSLYDYKTPTDHPTWKQMKEGQIHNKKICDDFLLCDFDKKSYISHYNILKLIPSHLHHYFWRGIIDGDGCFYIRKNKCGQSLSIASSYNQDWSSVITLCETLNIKSRITRKIDNRGFRSSTINIDNRKDIVLFGDYIYKNFESDMIGLARKYDKFQIIRQLFYFPPKFSRYHNSYKNIFLKSPGGDLIEVGKLTCFCKKYMLDIGGMKRVIDGRYIQWKGWTLPATTSDDIKSHTLLSYEKKAKEYDVIKNGVAIVIKNLFRYCRENNLGHASMKLLVKGKKKKYKEYQSTL